MLTQFFYQWNPFNVCGNEVGIEDLLSNPLKIEETLMQDFQGNCRRLQVPTCHSTSWQRVVFWLQTHLNDKGHLETIDKLISLFYQKLLDSPPQKVEALHQYHLQIKQLSSLKNDYGFVLFKTTDPSFVDSRLDEIAQKAYSIFADYYSREMSLQEEARKESIVDFQEKVDIVLQFLARQQVVGFLRARLLMTVPQEILTILFEEEIESIEDRLQIVHQVHLEIKELQRSLEGKYTLFFTHRSLKEMGRKLHREMGKIRIELELVIRNLVLNYQLTPFKDEVKSLLNSIGVDPEMLRERESEICASLFVEAIEFEMDKISEVL